MKRKNIHITEQQYAQLSQIAKNSGLTMAEHIRRAIDAYVERTLNQPLRTSSDLKHSPGFDTPDSRE